MPRPRNCVQKPRNVATPITMPAFSVLRQKFRLIWGNKMISRTMPAPKKRMAVNHVAPTVLMALLPITKPKPQMAAAVVRMRR